MNWEAIFAPVIGRELEGFEFLPITCDTLLLLSQLRQPSHWFSGAVCIGLGGQEIFLTWHQRSQTLEAMHHLEWSRFALDRINMSPETPWDRLHSATLRAVHLFSSTDVVPNDLFPVDPDSIVAAQHEFMGPAGGLSSLWICTGNDHDDTVCDGDNLLVSLDAPKNRANLNLKIKID